MNRLHYGDNLEVLRAHIADESVDLVYLDPPYNSSSSYNLLFKSPKGEASEAQIVAFEDTWKWGSESARSLEQLKYFKRRTCNTIKPNCESVRRKFAFCIFGHDVNSIG